MTKGEIATFHSVGFLRLPSITTEAEVKSITSVYDRLFERRAGWDSGDYFDFAGLGDAASEASVPQILDPSRYEPRLQRTQYRENAHAIARQLLGPSAELVFEHAMMKPARTGGVTTWHQDEAFYPKYTNYRSITFWMPLQPVDLENGCMEFIPYSHVKPLVPHHSINGDPRIPGLEADEVDYAASVPCPLPAGGVTIHHSRTLHYAGPNRSAGPRRAYILGFGVRSRANTLRKAHPWNLEKRTASLLRAAESRTRYQRCMRQMKEMAKAVLR